MEILISTEEIFYFNGKMYNRKMIGRLSTTKKIFYKKMNVELTPIEV
jgi:hypothetical protein